MGSKERKLSSSMTLAEEKSRAATLRGGGEKDGVQGAESEEMGLEVSEKKVAVVSKDGETENRKEAETAYCKEMRLENGKEIETRTSEEVERKLKKGDIVDMTSTGFEATGPEARLRKEM